MKINANTTARGAAAAEKGSHGLSYFSRLRYCVRALGLVQGWRYWRIQNMAIKHPRLALEWAAACEEQADAMEATHPQSASAFRQWAQELRYSHRHYVAKQHAKQP